MVVQLWTDQTQRLDAGTELTSIRGTLTVVSSKPFGPDDRYIVQFEGVFDRSAADSLRGVELEAEPLDDVADVLWVHELVGATVRDAARHHARDHRVGRGQPGQRSDGARVRRADPGPLRHGPRRGGAHVDVDIPEGLLDL